MDSNELGSFDLSCSKSLFYQLEFHWSGRQGILKSILISFSISDVSTWEFLCFSKNLIFGLRKFAQGYKLTKRRYFDYSSGILHDSRLQSWLKLRTFTIIPLNEQGNGLRSGYHTWDSRTKRILNKVLKSILEQPAPSWDKNYLIIHLGFTRWDQFEEVCGWTFLRFYFFRIHSFYKLIFIHSWSRWNRNVKHGFKRDLR